MIITEERPTANEETEKHWREIAGHLHRRGRGMASVSSYGAESEP